MKQKTYSSPKVDVTFIRFEENFLNSGQSSALENFELLDPDVEWE